MVTQFTKKPTALEIEQQVAEYLINHVGDRVCVAEVSYDPIREAWRVKLGLSYPFVGIVGIVGEALVTAESGIEQVTSLEEMKQRAEPLYDQNKEAIEAAFSQGHSS